MALENRKQRLLPFPQFLRRLARYSFFAFLLIFFSIAIGTIGYHHYADLPWVDSFYMACMILTGMGPVADVKLDNTAKVFSSLYALYSGIAFLSISAVFFTPIIHRFLHKLHVDDE